ncbi:Uncharacterized protein family UPF0324 [Sphingobium chlorophenolicum L-1]|uniref:Uncharacterized protein family UPF0324 n=1 Tax=Sphingobium chlorophenolicum L-1 TaxID=690566 RepID=F6EWL2_SPHCR|nr:putative sulfate exporter family transporter [Sphingobium chlorophenolicum]AEG48984.1 Uncharacterized protein family UPF0324 [Sphingobium chlorophenolicum L-1]
MANILAADLYCDIPADTRHRWREYVPGLTVVLLGTLAAGFLSDHYGAPLTLMALLLGLALNFLSSDKRLLPGLGFASRTLLRWGIVLLGMRVTAAQIADLGPVALLCAIAIVALTIGSGVLAARWLKLGTNFGLLAGGSVAICGASAAMALATTLGSRRVNDANLSLVLVGISAMSATAMMLYPVAAHMLGLSDMQAGFLLGASIHDVAQALGAGYAYSVGAGQIAAIVKLSRVALLAPILAIITLFLRDERRERIGVPWFVVGFFGLAGVNSLGLIPSVAAGLSTQAASALLAAAVTATAIRSPLANLMKTGARPILTILAATIVAFLLSLLAALLAIR